MIATSLDKLLEAKRCLFGPNDLPQPQPPGKGGAMASSWMLNLLHGRPQRANQHSPDRNHLWSDLLHESSFGVLVFLVKILRFHWPPTPDTTKTIRGAESLFSGFANLRIVFI